MKKIVLLDPALRDNNKVSTNLGDCIISESTNKILNSIFNNEFEIIQISTLTPLEKTAFKILKESEMIFIGGSNLLSSHLLEYNQWKFFKNPNYFDYLFARKFNMILMGVGWWQYQGEMDWTTKHFYGRILSESYIHSVRDKYSQQKLLPLERKKIVNTSCPTTWGLDGLSMDRVNKNSDTVILTLTDYNTDVDKDSYLIRILLKYYKKIYFFPQGSRDQDYFVNLEVYQQNKSRFKILSNEIEPFFKFAQDNTNVDYIGTRLHGGIKCLQNSIQSLIVSVDNRAIEISKDINLAVVERSKMEEIENWILGKTTFGKIELNNDAINTWKTQFSTRR